jgi:two-component system alkaline phosphatase synthesis response regulator PhoP
MNNRILVVEDNPELLELLLMILKEAGYHVATAADGVEALKQARSFSPHLVLLDLVLPELDGFAVCQMLRCHASTAQTPIIVMTGLNNDFSRFAGLEAGATEYVTKPVTPGHLVSRIQQRLQSSASPVKSHS